MGGKCLVWDWPQLRCWCCGFARSAVALALALGIVSVGQPRAAGPEWDDELVGPFGSWKNVKTEYGASGDGVADDTAALQSALTEVGTSGRSSVLYIPAGVYRVTSTLRLTSRIHISIIGADPATTTLRWAGGTDGVLFKITGMAYSRVDRLTFDGAGQADVLVDQAWDCKNEFFDTGNEYADDVFRGAKIGIRGGNSNCGFAETSVWRSQFVELTTAGIALKNFNALDLWVWYSRFDHCGVGVTNDPGAGNYHVYDSVFRNSEISDLYMKNTGGFNIRNNTSIGSKAFFTTEPSFLHPAGVTLQGNAISTSSATPIAIGNQGPAVIIDNQIASADGAPPITVGYDMLLRDGDALVVGNRFTSSAPFVVKGRSIDVDNVSSARLTIVEPALPPTPPLRARSIFDVPAGANAATIQLTINKARVAGPRAVVHLPAGEYSIAAPLVVPSGADIQIIGDGVRSALNWTGGTVGPVLRIEGPTHVVLRDFSLRAGQRVEGIAIDRADQAGARVYLNQAQMAYSTQANLFIDGVDALVVDARDFGHGSGPGGSVTVVGGPLAASGRPKTAAVNIFSGASCCNTGPSYRLSNGGSLLVRDIWYESGGVTPYLTATGGGRFTVAGARVSQPVSVPAFELKGFRGLATLLANGVDSLVSVQGDASGMNLFASGLVIAPTASRYLNDESQPRGQVVFQQMRKMTARGGSNTLPGLGRVSPAWVRRMLEQTRQTQPQTIGTLPADVTDVRLHRVTSNYATVGVHVRP